MAPPPHHGIACMGPGLTRDDALAAFLLGTSARNRAFPASDSSPDGASLVSWLDTGHHEILSLVRQQLDELVQFCTFVCCPPA